VANSKNKTIITAGSEYQSIKSTERYTPDTAPINYQSQSTVTEENKEVPRITLIQDKAKKKLNIQKSFLESLTSVYISGQYALKGHRSFRVREIISLIIHNTGLYRVVTNSSLKQTIIDIIENGDEVLLGERITEYQRERILGIFKRDNVF
jgi:hypothetical protein